MGKVGNDSEGKHMPIISSIHYLSLGRRRADPHSSNPWAPMHGAFSALRSMTLDSSMQRSRGIRQIAFAFRQTMLPSHFYGRPMDCLAADHQWLLAIACFFWDLDITLNLVVYVWWQAR